MRKIFVLAIGILSIAWATKPGANPYYDCMLANRKPCESIKPKREQDACIAKAAHDCQCRTWDPAILATYNVTCP